MNTYMYEHFLTAKQVKILLEEFKFIQIPSISKKLMCGDIGQGGIADTKDLYEIISNYMYTDK
jgi:phosphopantothenoylcysteine decarboxylase